MTNFFIFGNLQDGVYTEFLGNETALPKPPYNWEPKAVRLATYLLKGWTGEAFVSPDEGVAWADSEEADPDPVGWIMGGG